MTDHEMIYSVSKGNKKAILNLASRLIELNSRVVELEKEVKELKEKKDVSK